MLSLGRKHSFLWTADCETAFEVLKQKLVTSPLLAYSDFDKDFYLETHSSRLGLGAIYSITISGWQEVTSHSLCEPICVYSWSKLQYSITDLGTLAVVWAVTHLRYYLYGHNVYIFTNHAAIKAILGAPNLTGKRARWWSKLYGNGIKNINIIHRSGKKKLIVFHDSRCSLLHQLMDLLRKFTKKQFLVNQEW